MITTTTTIKGRTTSRVHLADRVAKIRDLVEEAANGNTTSITVAVSGHFNAGWGSNRNRIDAKVTVKG